MVRVVFEKTIEQTLQANLSDQKKQTIDVAGVVKSIEMMGMVKIRRFVQMNLKESLMMKLKNIV